DGPPQGPHQSHLPPATIRRTRERSWSGDGGGRHGFRGRRRGGRFLFGDDLVPARVADRTHVDDSARRVARLGPVVRAVVLLRHLIPPKDTRHLWFSGWARFRRACRGSSRVGRTFFRRT